MRKIKSCLPSAESFSAPSVSASSPSSEGDLRFNSAMFTDDVGDDSMRRTQCVRSGAGDAAEIRARIGAGWTRERHRPWAQLRLRRRREEGRKSCEAIGAAKQGQGRQRYQSEMNVAKWSSMDVGHDERQLTPGASQRVEEGGIASRASERSVRRGH